MSGSDTTGSPLTPDADETSRVGHKQQEQLQWLSPIVHEAIAQLVEARLETRAVQEKLFSAPTINRHLIKLAYLATALAQKEASIAGLDEDILDCQSRKDNLMKEVNNLMKEMDNLMNEMRTIRSRERDEANSFRFLLAPIRLLSPEVLAQIFQHAVPAKPPPRQVSSPLGLSHVCSAWRNAILGSSTFWNKLSIQVGVHARGDPNIITSWFNRANSTAPLSLSLSHETNFHYLPKSMYSSMVNFSHRLTDLQISGDYGFLSEFLQLPGKILPMLETLFLDGFIITDVDDDKESGYKPYAGCRDPLIYPFAITVFDDSPRLRFVTLGLSAIAFRKQSLLALSWSLVTHLDIRRAISRDAFARLMYRCPQLQVASFIVSTEEEDGFRPSGSVRLLDLVLFKLEVHHTNRQNALPLMPMPNLETLELVEDQSGLTSFPLNIIYPGILNSLASIRCLRLSKISSDMEILGQLVSACPMLEDLRLHVYDLDAISQLRCLALHPQRYDQQALPPPPSAHLASFTFTCALERHESIETVGAVFSKLVCTWAKDPRRCRPLENLSLYIWHWFYPLDEDVHRVRERMRGKICDAVKQAQSSRPVVNVDYLCPSKSLTDTFWRPF
ncbi:hypothetical protein D9615_009665 [Tricholomella constricta]|uniref:F-box domain-containing protein n=1 Tax=Tricholomella constricta TaxID=117010 RepID=A0A8H5GU91_9AGAR|nr:hypothetical protein D9615_009665 [Tricholomella constricta]